MGWMEASRTLKPGHDSQEPQILHHLGPLFAVLRFQGIAPYSLGPSLRLVRNRPFLILTALLICGQLAITLYWFSTGTHAKEALKNRTVDLVLSFLTMATNISFPLYALVSGATTNFAPSAELLQRLLHAQHILKNEPCFTQRRWIIAMMVGVFVSDTLFTFLWYWFWNASLLELVYYAWELALMHFICQMFCILVLIITAAFKNVNQELLMLAENLKKDDNPFTALDDKISFLMGRCGELTNTNIATVNESRNEETIERILERIVHLQVRHFKLQGICNAVENVFRGLLLFSYAYFIISTVETLYHMALTSRTGLSSYQIAGLGMSAALHAVWAVAVTAAAGGAAAAAGEGGAVRAAVELLASAGGVPAVERQVQLLLVQLRASAVQFTAGGLIPIDMRLLVELIGTILGYLIIVVEFATPAAATCYVKCHVNGTFETT